MRIDDQRRQAADLPFELRSRPSASIDDLDLVLFERKYLKAAVAPEVLDENRRSLDDQLRALRFLDQNGHPTVLGLLVVGNDPRAFVGGAYIQFVRFQGTELADPIRSQQEIRGPLPDLIHRIDQVLEANIEVATTITERSVEIRHPDYPLVALQQLVRNAVLHRSYDGTNAPVRCYWYDDRVEISGPGGPYGRVTAENLGQPAAPDSRNRYLAEAMRVLDLVQRFGVGIAIARRELAKNDNPPPRFDVQPTSVRVSVHKRPEGVGYQAVVSPDSKPSRKMNEAGPRSKTPPPKVPA